MGIDIKAAEEHRWHMGTGYWSRANCETCMLGTRGKPSPKCHSVRRLIISPRREHSRKPDEAYDRIEALCEGPYVELFARYNHPGWDTAFSTLEGSVERRWKSNEGKSIDYTYCENCDSPHTCRKQGFCTIFDPRKPIDIMSLV